MAEKTKIQWADATFNPWIGCQKVSPACDFCYAEEQQDHRYGRVTWGAKGARSLTSAANWKKPVRWSLNADPARPLRVFCASLADIFDNHKTIAQEWRDEFWKLVRDTPNLRWMLLTKRPQNIERFLTPFWDEIKHRVWLGVSVENQEEANRRIPILLQYDCPIRFLSMEPLLESVDLTSAWNGETALNPECWGDCQWCNNGNPPLHNCRKYQPTSRDLNVIKSGVDWVIAGGESGRFCRPSKPDWFRTIRDDCHLDAVPFFFKQWGGKTPAEVKKNGNTLDGKQWLQLPEFE